ncbi:site-specific integrase [Streptacidiphilus sp. P02-A3a]|uniref:tyrosine-type recombinase/integrase n=1 Tax=Streptacidiphilus sp. P02-A3a TaxID=2704468 RepID=UPI001CDC4DE5|nr:site-specific integrase [Streptacidiphilus sp. P02-A3a]
MPPVRTFLIDFIARDNRTGSVRSYAYDLLRWWRWLRVLDVEWDKATSAEVRDFVLWLGAATKPRRAARTHSAATASTTNPITKKTYLDDRYKPRTIRHSNAVIRAFYDFWIQSGGGPLINPVPLARSDRRRAHAHHNPLEPFRGEARLRYNPRIPRRRPRQMPDEQWNELFAALRSNRDRAILATAVSNGARASELLGVRGVDLDWGDQLVRVVRKGTLAEQWLPTSPEAMIWIRLYLAEGPPLDLQAPLWWTLRRRNHGERLAYQPMNYEALRAVFRRVNVLLGTNWSMHDLRHTAALRMSRDERLSLRDVQTILGHAHMSTTADIYLVEEDEHVIRRVAEHLADIKERAARPAPPVANGYSAEDLHVLFGGGH